MVWFSRVRLRSDVDGSTGSLVAYLAKNSRDIGAAHQLVWSLFGNRGGIRPYVFRMTGPSLREDVLLYSSEPPQDTNGLWDIESKPFEPRYKPGGVVTFSIRLNATVYRDGKRHDLVMDARTRDPAMRRMDRNRVAQIVIPPWLAPRLDRYGLEAMQDAEGKWMMSVDNYATDQFHHDQGHRVKLGMVDIRGLARVMKPELLGDTLLKGIGRGEAYGCGMLLVKPAGTVQ
jgi:CRISPR system Cascade subunit CasE